MTAGNEASREPIDIARLLAGTSLARVEHHASIGSTQDRAQALAAETAADGLPLLVVADEQTSGRGRGANRWWTGRGSLAFSLIVDPAAWGLDERVLPLRSLAVGLAIVDVVTLLLAAEDRVQRVGLHWPNDVFVGDRKLSGVLVDVLPNGRHVIGVGLNLNNSLEGAPPEVASRATSLFDLTGKSIDRTEALILLVNQLESRLREASHCGPQLAESCQRVCLQLDSELVVQSGPTQHVGRCLGIAPDGALLLATRTGVERIYSGVLR